MAISIVNVVVPASGDGPIANISNLIGEKTVELSGHFVGRYILLGSHNGVNFVPVLIFDANGEESIKLTLKLALVSVRVRAAAAAPLGVTMNVSGVLSPGCNLFTTLGTLTPGMSGQQPPIDLNVLFPPTGVEQDINLLCVGGFDGLIVIRGSLDGIHFNPIDGFRSDDQPLASIGPAPTLEFSPLTTKDLIRYVQLDIQGTISAATVISLGGSNPPSGAATAPKLLELTEEEGRVVPSDTEVILYEWAVNLNDLPIGPNIVTQINALIQTIPPLEASSTSTFNVYIGSTTPGSTVGGTLRASINTTSGFEELVTATGVPFGNAGGLCLVQVTGVGSYPQVQSNIRALTINIG
jgi:hypothetical protein